MKKIWIQLSLLKEVVARNESGLRKIGAYISDSLYNRVLKNAGELQR